MNKKNRAGNSNKRKYSSLYLISKNLYKKGIESLIKKNS